ncbi:MAG: metal-dependent transcriptional regulator [Candidatus Lokiarchaeota archaeon]|nr:metal-dependent transcriptional regulator [Candidatus Lokiarchaeota archaeon]
MDKITESFENYLKAIYLISKKNRGGWVSNSEISDFLGVKPPSVTSILHKLKQKDFVNWKPRKSLRLTSKGKIVAQNIIDKYNHLKHFFKDVLKLKDALLLENLCCGIEHHITPEVSKALENLYIDQI